MSRRPQTRNRLATLGVAGEDVQESPSDRQAVTRPWASWDPSTAWTGLFLVALVLVTVFLYQPALHRVFVADQLCYFIELNGSQSLWDGLRHYDYPASRRYDKGDESLYRPLFFVWLAVNNWLFGNNYFWWNVVALGLHLVVVMLLFALLREFQPSPTAGAFAFLFAVMPSQMDLVTWHHLGGYLAGFALLLLALIAMQRVIADRQPSGKRWLVVFTVSMTAAALFYELLVVMSALVAIYLCCLEFRQQERIRWRVVVASLIPGVIFTGLYIVHALRCPRLFFVDRARHGSHVVILILEDAVAQCWVWLKQTLCPWNYAFVTYPYGRSSLGLAKGPDASDTMVYWVILACLLLLIGLWRTFNWTHVRRRAPLAMILVAMIGAYTTLVAAGRQGGCATIPYYLYFFALILVILVYILLDWNPAKIRLTPVLCGFVVLAIASASLTYDATLKLAKVNREPDRYFTSLRRFVHEHRQEPDFSFVVRDSQNVDITVGVMVGYPDTATQQVLRPISGILFPRYYDPKNPRYILQWKNGALTVVNQRS